MKNESQGYDEILVHRWKNNLEEKKKDATFEENNEVLKVKAYPKEWKMAIVCSIYNNNEKLYLA